MSDSLPGKGLWGWLGRQFGHVRRAIRADVTRQVVHRERHVQEAELPGQPDVKLRRTVIDEVIVQKRPAGGKGDAGSPEPGR